MSLEANSLQCFVKRSMRARVDHVIIIVSHTGT